MMKGNSSGNAPTILRGNGVGVALLKEMRNAGADDRFPPIR